MRQARKEKKKVVGPSPFAKRTETVVLTKTSFKDLNKPWNKANGHPPTGEGPVWMTGIKRDALFFIRQFLSGPLFNFGIQRASISDLSGRSQK